MKKNLGNSIKSFLVELVLYGVLVTAYYFLVLHFLGNWLHELFQTNRRMYAAVALGLIIGQGLLLEILTRLLLSWITPRTEGG